jgi:hypothetical protein
MNENTELVVIGRNQSAVSFTEVRSDGPANKSHMRAAMKASVLGRTSTVASRWMAILFLFFWGILVVIFGGSQRYLWI